MGFTSVVQGLDIHSASFINEIIQAFNERVPESFERDLISTGDVAYLRTFWRTGALTGIQNRVERQWSTTTNAQVTGEGTYTIPMKWMYPADVSMPTGTNPPTPSFLEMCELNTNMSDYGWRRASNWDPSSDDWTDLDDPMWSRVGNGHGGMQTGDIIGPWIFEDLQNALKAMKTRRLDESSIHIGDRAYGGGSSDWAVSESRFLDDIEKEYNKDLPSLRPYAWSEWASSNAKALSRSKTKAGMYQKFGLPSYGANPSLLSPSIFASGCVADDPIKYVMLFADMGGGFDNQGDAFAVNNQYNTTHTGTIGSWTAYSGSLDLPARAEAIDTYRGYQFSGNASNVYFAFLTLDNLQYE